MDSKISLIRKEVDKNTVRSEIVQDTHDFHVINVIIIIGLQKKGPHHSYFPTDILTDLRLKYSVYIHN